MSYKVIFHLNLNDEMTFNQGLNNVMNLLKSIPDEEYDIIMLFNGPAVSLMAWDDCLPFLERIKEFHARQVRFLVCENALHKFEVNRDDLIEECELTPAGITALIDLQNQGYAYIKP